MSIVSFLKYAFHRPQAIMRYVRKDRVELRKKDGWKIVKEGFGDLVLMRKG